MISDQTDHQISVNFLTFSISLIIWPFLWRTSLCLGWGWYFLLVCLFSCFSVNTDFCRCQFINSKFAMHDSERKHSAFLAIFSGLKVPIRYAWVPSVLTVFLCLHDLQSLGFSFVFSEKNIKILSTSSPLNPWFIQCKGRNSEFS